MWKWAWRCMPELGICCLYYIVFVAASVVVLSLIPLYLPSKGLNGIDIAPGTFYFILLYLWFVLNCSFSGTSLLVLRCTTNVTNNQFFTAENAVSVANQVDCLLLSLSSSYLYFFRYRNNSILNNFLSSMLNFNHNRARLEWDELERQSMYTYYLLSFMIFVSRKRWRYFCSPFYFKNEQESIFFSILQASLLTI
jgi:hypothetical protein